MSEPESEDRDSQDAVEGQNAGGGLIHQLQRTYWTFDAFC